MKFPILAMLASSPAHGYELKRELEHHFGAALPPLNTGQIYTSLARLERDGLVDADRVAQDSRPNKRVYRLTDAGRVARADWVAQPTPGTRLRGLDRPTRGEVHLGERRVDQLSEAAWAILRRRQIGFVFQFFNLIANLTVADNIELPGLLGGLALRDARSRRRELLADLAIE